MLMQIIKCIHYDSACYVNKGGADSAAHKGKTIDGDHIYPNIWNGIKLYGIWDQEQHINKLVQPSISDENYNELIKTIGENKINTHLNTPNAKISYHYVIGKDVEYKTIATQILPNNIVSWEYNNVLQKTNYINQASICVLCGTDFISVYEYIKELCAALCKNNLWDAQDVVFADDIILSWMNKYNITEEIFFKELSSLIKNINPKVNDIVHYDYDKYYTSAYTDERLDYAKPSDLCISKIYNTSTHKYKVYIKDINKIAYVDGGHFSTTDCERKIEVGKNYRLLNKNVAKNPNPSEGDFREIKSSKVRLLKILNNKTPYKYLVSGIDGNGYVKIDDIKI